MNGQCEYEVCDFPPVRQVRTALGLQWFCADHAARVREIEREWDRAEAEMLEQY